MRETNLATGGGFSSCYAVQDSAALGTVVRCKGLNSSGQLGNGTWTNGLVTVTGLTNPVWLTGGYAHHCAVLANGRMKCWGSNAFGQLGDGGTQNQNVPVFVAASGPPVPLQLANVAAAAAGASHTCALMGDGTVRCWGANDSGQLGDGTTTQRAYPTVVSGITNAIAIDAGLYHSCALLANGTVACWGQNAVGQLGNGTQNNQLVAQVVAGLSGVQAISTTYFGTCAKLLSGQVRCWGRNDFGQVGAGTMGAPVLVPTAVRNSANTANLTEVAAMDGGGYHNCVRPEYGSPQCWGRNQSSELGDNTTVSRALPADVQSGTTTLVPSISFVVLGGEHSLDRNDSRGVCWGRNDFGQCFPSVLTVYPAAHLTPTARRPFSVDTGADHSTASTSSITASVYWGRNDLGQTALQPGADVLVPATGNLSSSTHVEGVSSGSTCLLDHDGTMRCWGDNDHGQLGDGTTLNRLGNVGATTPLDRVAMYSANSDGTTDTVCAVRINGAAYCWGENTFGQVGDGTSGNNRLVATAVSGLTNALSIDVGARHACAVRVGGTVVCWGDNDAGQLGDGTTTDHLVPAVVPGLANAVSVACGTAFSCARLANGTVQCWGANSSGQLGDGTVLSHSTPAAVSGLSNVVALSAGGAQACALLADGTARCWGTNGFGVLGDGTTTQRTTPVSVSGLGDVARIVTANYTSCAALATNKSYCWGRNQYGQLGNGTTSNSYVPSLVLVP